MKTTIQLCFISLIVLCFSCDSGNVSQNEVKNNLAKQDSVESEQQKKYLETKIASLRIRKTPSLDGELVITLPEGEVLTYLDEKTDKTEKITLRGKEFDEPWLKVHYEKGNIDGWVYGGAVEEIDAAKAEKALENTDIKDGFYCFTFALGEKLPTEIVFSVEKGQVEGSVYLWEGNDSYAESKISGAVAKNELKIKIQNSDSENNILKIEGTTLDWNGNKYQQTAFGNLLISKKIKAQKDNSDDFSTGNSNLHSKDKLTGKKIAGVYKMYVSGEPVVAYGLYMYFILNEHGVVLMSYGTSPEQAFERVDSKIKSGKISLGSYEIHGMSIRLDLEKSTKITTWLYSSVDKVFTNETAELRFTQSLDFMN